MSVIKKLNDLFSLIREIADEDPGSGQLLMESFTIALNVMKITAEKGKRGTVNLDEQIDLVSRALNFPLEDLVRHIMSTKQGDQPSVMSQTDNTCGNPNCSNHGNNINNKKEADQDVLDFITTASDVKTDEYEAFLEDNEVKVNLEYLKKEV